MMYVLITVIGVLLGVAFLALFVGWYISEEGYQGPVSDHFDGKVFYNLSGHDAKELRDVAKYGAKRKPDKWVRNYETDVRDIPIPEVREGKVQVTFVNHSTFLIQTLTMNILTDPMWSERCSPIQFAGPRRMRPPGIRFEDLPRIDLVLLSHNHYDHFDVNTLRKIEKSWSPKYIAPLGVDKLLSKIGCKDVQVVDWHNELSVHDIRVKATPANHFSARGMMDRNQTLWCGYIMYIDDFVLYFAGDTGYGDCFKEIGHTEGSIDLALIPIGAYKPEWFMSPVHISPDEALRVHHDVNARYSIAMHFGTFSLADDNPETSTQALLATLEKNQVDPKYFIIPDEGHSYIYEK